MKKELKKLSQETLNKLGKDYSLYGTKTELIDKISEYMKCYDIRWSDLVCRYDYLKA